jgi:hypothetical protein
MKIKGNLSLSSFHKSIISLALKTNELDEKIHLFISLPIMVRWNPPIQRGSKTHLLFILNAILGMKFFLHSSRTFLFPS